MERSEGADEVVPVYIIKERGGTSPLMLPLASDGCDRSASCFLPLQTRGNSSRYQQNRRLGEPQRRFGPSR